MGLQLLIKDRLENGQTVVALIPIGSYGTHWVTIYGYENGNFLIANPWGGYYQKYSENTLNSYLNNAGNRKVNKGYGYSKEAVAFGNYSRPN